MSSSCHQGQRASHTVNVLSVLATVYRDFDFMLTASVEYRTGTFLLDDFDFIENMNYRSSNYCQLALLSTIWETASLQKTVTVKFVLRDGLELGCKVQERHRQGMSMAEFY